MTSSLALTCDQCFVEESIGTVYKTATAGEFYEFGDQNIMMDRINNDTTQYIKNVYSSY